MKLPFSLSLVKFCNNFPPLYNPRIFLKRTKHTINQKGTPTSYNMFLLDTSNFQLLVYIVNLSYLLEFLSPTRFIVVVIDAGGLAMFVLNLVNIG